MPYFYLKLLLVLSERTASGLEIGVFPYIKVELLNLYNDAFLERQVPNFKHKE